MSTPHCDINTVGSVTTTLLNVYSWWRDELCKTSVARVSNYDEHLTVAKARRSSPITTFVLRWEVGANEIPSPLHRRRRTTDIGTTCNRIIVLAPWIVIMWLIWNVGQETFERNDLFTWLDQGRIKVGLMLSGNQMMLEWIMADCEAETVVRNECSRTIIE